MAEYLQRGEALDYTNATDNLIPHDTVVALKDRDRMPHPSRQNR